ncbi:MAG TPA: hypothetical protein VGR87_04760 [Candidatus Limnocylindria bacterium]|jgi:hypothetical protein|nr:hypothetical protein [Candidatus Limnocylindria bacterium]
MKIGVEVRLAGDAGDLLADARAFEAAGADSLWVVGREDQDPWTLLAALAAVTWRARLVALDSSERPEALATVERLSRGRLVVATRDGDMITLPAAEGDAERWARSDFPAGRPAWKELRAKLEAEGFAGIAIPNDPRLLDLLRNPDTEDDREDLKLAFG